MRRLLRSIDIDPRPRSKQAHEVPTDLILSAHDGGMSARQIAAKHGIVGHRRILDVLRENGRQPHHCGSSKGNRAVVLGSRVNLQAARRRVPPMVIPGRTAAERMVRTWTVTELAAIAPGPTRN